MLEKSTQIRVRFAETDAMGVVYHANYLPWMEAARIELLDSLGLSYKNIIKLGLHIPVLEVHIKYRASAFFDDRVNVRAMIRERPGVKISIDYEISRDGKILSEARTVHAFVDSSGAPVKPPAQIISRLRELFDESQKNG